MSNPDGYMLNGKMYQAPFAFTENAVMEYITELEAENKRLRGALGSIAKEEDTLGWIYAARIAKIALEENNNEG